MASEDTLLGNEWKLQLVTAGSPPTYADFDAVIDFPSMGEEKNLVEVTAYTDDARTYRNGMADGVEIPVQCNFLPGDSQIQSMYDAYTDNTLVALRFTTKDSSEYFDFNAIVRAWTVAPPIGDRATVTFTLKISGGVTWQQAA